MQTVPISRDPAETDSDLVERCLRRDQHAWQRLYELFHEPLLRVIEHSLVAANPELVDEVAARVWYAVAKDDFALLRRFDPQRCERLLPFIAGIARKELAAFARSEGRRRIREQIAGEASLTVQLGRLAKLPVGLEEFLETLTENERRFCRRILLSATPARSIWSEGNIRQLRRRVRLKLERFMA